MTHEEIFTAWRGGARTRLCHCVCIFSVVGALSCDNPRPGPQRVRATPESPKLRELPRTEITSIEGEPLRELRTNEPTPLGGEFDVFGWEIESRDNDRLVFRALSAPASVVADKDGGEIASFEGRLRPLTTRWGVLESDTPTKASFVDLTTGEQRDLWNNELPGQGLGIASLVVGLGDDVIWLLSDGEGLLAVQVQPETSTQTTRKLDSLGGSDFASWTTHRGRLFLRTSDCEVASIGPSHATCTVQEQIGEWRAGGGRLIRLPQRIGRLEAPLERVWGLDGAGVRVADIPDCTPQAHGIDPVGGGILFRCGYVQGYDVKFGVFTPKNEALVVDVRTLPEVDLSYIPAELPAYFPINPGRAAERDRVIVGLAGSLLVVSADQHGELLAAANRKALLHKDANLLTLDLETGALQAVGTFECDEQVRAWAVGDNFYATCSPRAAWLQVPPVGCDPRPHTPYRVINVADGWWTETGTSIPLHVTGTAVFAQDVSKCDARSRRGSALNVRLLKR